jgi:hypothetical protein|tara:strand:+ start:632 stop:892 length:261 start_codon:yes stop_codon:yes gene_type:complete
MEGTQLTIEEIIDINPEAMMADGFDEAILGMCIQFGSEPIVAYDYEKCIQILMKRDDMNKADALDFMEFNVIGAYVGLNTPVFIMR